MVVRALPRRKPQAGQGAGLRPGQSYVSAIRDAFHAALRNSCVQQFEQYFRLDSAVLDDFTGELRLRSDHWHSSMLCSYAGISTRLQIHYSIPAARCLVECMVGNTLEIGTEHLRSAVEEFCNLTVAKVKRSIETLVENAEHLPEVTDYSVGIPKTKPVLGGATVDSLDGSELRGWLLQSLPGTMVGTTQVVVDEGRLAASFPELALQSGKTLAELNELLERLPGEVLETGERDLLLFAA